MYAKSIRVLTTDDPKSPHDSYMSYVKENGILILIERRWEVEIAKFMDFGLNFSTFRLSSVDSKL